MTETERQALEALARRLWGWNEAPAGADPDEWVHRWDSFRKMLDAEAYESAALMCVPDDCLAMMRHLWDGDKKCGYAVVDRYEGGMWKAGHDAVADTPALALCAAIEAAINREQTCPTQ